MARENPPARARCLAVGCACCGTLMHAFALLNGHRVQKESRTRTTLCCRPRHRPRPSFPPRCPPHRLQVPPRAPSVELVATLLRRSEQHAAPAAVVVVLHPREQRLPTPAPSPTATQPTEIILATQRSPKGMWPGSSGKVSGNPVLGGSGRRAPVLARLGGAFHGGMRRARRRESSGTWTTGTGGERRDRRVWTTSRGTSSTRREAPRVEPTGRCPRSVRT